MLPPKVGRMFEELMPDLFVPEAAWGPRSWALNHPLAVRAQRVFGLEDAGYGAWGFSPASRPGGGYSEWGVEPVSALVGGYPSDLARTTLAQGTWGDGVVTPHAVALALPYEPTAAHAMLHRLEDDLHCYGPGGFLDAVAVRSGLVADRHLSLDQAMLLGALGNVLADDILRRGFAGPEAEAALRPLLSAERFAVGTDLDDPTDADDTTTRHDLPGRDG